MINNEKKTVTYSAFMVRDLIKQNIPAFADHIDGKTLINVCKNAFDLKSGGLDKSKFDSFKDYMSKNGYKYDSESADKKEFPNINDQAKKALTKQCTAAYVFHAEINYASKDMVRDLIAQKIPASADHSGGKTWIHVCATEANLKYDNIDEFKNYMSENGYTYDDKAVDYHKEVFTSYDKKQEAPTIKSTCPAYIFYAEMNSDFIVRELLTNNIPARNEYSDGKTWIYVSEEKAVQNKNNKNVHSFKSYDDFADYMIENGYKFNNKDKRQVYTTLENFEKKKEEKLEKHDSYIFYVRH